MDGAKPVLSEAEGIKANASKHKAMSWDYAHKLEAQLRTEVEELIRRAVSESEQQGQQETNIPAELQRREVRLAKITEVKAELERRAQRASRRNKPTMQPSWKSGKKKNNNVV